MPLHMEFEVNISFCRQFVVISLLVIITCGFEIRQLLLAATLRPNAKKEKVFSTTT